jgi:hypothetical protein
MTDEQEFEKTVRERLAKAAELTGYSFAGFLNACDKFGASTAALKLISRQNLGRFQPGMRVLYRADLLKYSVEQAIIDFGRLGKVFTGANVKAASDRLQLMRFFIERDS